MASDEPASSRPEMDIRDYQTTETEIQTQKQRLRLKMLDG